MACFPSPRWWVGGVRTPVGEVVTSKQSHPKVTVSFKMPLMLQRLSPFRYCVAVVTQESVSKTRPQVNPPSKPVAVSATSAAQKVATDAAAKPEAKPAKNGKCACDICILMFAFVGSVKDEGLTGTFETVVSILSLP